MKEGLHILQYFLEHPFHETYLRELAKTVGISPSATKQYLDLLLAEGLIKEKRTAVHRYVYAATDNLTYKHLKIAWNLRQLKTLRIVDEILNKYSQVISIMLYGSYAKGLNDEHSDIDIVVIGTAKKPVHLSDNVSIRTYTWAQWKSICHTNKPFYDEVLVHGICLHGEVPVL